MTCISLCFERCWQVRTEAGSARGPSAGRAGANALVSTDMRCPITDILLTTARQRLRSMFLCSLASNLAVVSSHLPFEDAASTSARMRTLPRLSTQLVNPGSFGWITSCIGRGLRRSAPRANREVALPWGPQADRWCLAWRSPSPYRPHKSGNRRATPARSHRTAGHPL